MEGGSGEKAAPGRKAGSRFGLSPSSELRLQTLKHTSRGCPSCKSQDGDTPKETSIWGVGLGGSGGWRVREELGSFPVFYNFTKEWTPGNLGLLLPLTYILSIVSGFLQFLSRILDIPAIMFKWQFPPRRCGLFVTSSNLSFLWVRKENKLFRSPDLKKP